MKLDHIDVHIIATTLDAGAQPRPGLLVTLRFIIASREYMRRVVLRAHQIRQSLTERSTA